MTHPNRPGNNEPPASAPEAEETTVNDRIRIALAYLNVREYLADRHLTIEWAIDDALIPDDTAREAGVRASVTLLHPGRHRLYREVYNAAAATRRGQ